MRCVQCGEIFPDPGWNRRHCGKCRPFYTAVYRFICPDGRSYVGSREDCQWRERVGIKPSNARLRKALKKYPAHTWKFEIIEMLKYRSNNQYMREQYHIERLRTMDPRYGFNVVRAWVKEEAHLAWKKADVSAWSDPQPAGEVA
jgi:hypothetical protein